jgi:peroxiredoxin
MRSVAGEPTTLAAAIGGGPAVLVFYRGGWCPYCNVQLSGLRLIREPLQALGYQLIAISPDRPEALRESLANAELDYTLLSDAKAEAMISFGLAFRVDAETQEQYRGYGIDLAAAAGEDHGLLPVPAVYIVDGEGVLQFSYVHPDYRVRLPEAAVLAAAEAIAAQRHKVKPAR